MSSDTRSITDNHDSDKQKTDVSMAAEDNSHADVNHGESAELQTPDARDELVSDSPTALATPRADSAPLDTSKQEPATKKLQKRKSSGGIPEHKKKLQRKKSIASLETHLDAKPGQHYWAKMKGYPPWPAVICDEEMLSEQLLKTRPVTAAHADGTYRPDYRDGGKNANDRTYPIMFLHTNEFAWIPNTDLNSMDMDEVANAEPTKKSKQLWQAYLVAQKSHTLSHYKQLLLEHQEAINQIKAEEQQKEADKQARKEKKAGRKSKDDKGDEFRDTSLHDHGVDANGNSVQKSKPSKKRKKDTDSDADAPAAKKTPKSGAKIKLTATKVANDESLPRQKSTGNDEPVGVLSNVDEKLKREKEVLYFRHRLQKGFISRDSAPQGSEMNTMDQYFSNLEEHSNLEASIIRSTKIHKVMRAILKLSSIPRDDDYHFKDRAMRLLETWQNTLAKEVSTTTSSDPNVAISNGTNKETTDVKKAADEDDSKDSEAVQSVETSIDLGDSKDPSAPKALSENPT